MSSNHPARPQTEDEEDEALIRDDHMRRVAVWVQWGFATAAYPEEVAEKIVDDLHGRLRDV